MAPDNVSVPEPDFVSEPEPVVTAATDDVPGLSIVNAMLVAVTPPDNVNDDPESICTSDADVDSVTAAEITFVPDVLRIAPADDTPDPVIVSGSATVIPPDTDNAAPDDTVVPVPVPPNADALLIATTPAEIVVAPVYVFVADNVRVPDPVLVTLPELVAIGSATVMSPVLVSRVRS